MAGILSAAVTAGIFALTNVGAEYGFKKLMSSNPEEEQKRHDIAVEQTQKAQSAWVRERQKKIDFYNQFLQQQGLATRNINDINEAAQ